MLTQFVESFLRFWDDVYTSPRMLNTQPRQQGPRCGSYYEKR